MQRDHSWKNISLLWKLISLWKRFYRGEKGHFSSSLIFSPPAPPSVHYGSALVNPPHHAYLMSPKIAKMRLGSDLFSFFKSRFRAITVFYWSFHRSIWVAFSFSFSLFPFKKTQMCWLTFSSGLFAYIWRIFFLESLWQKTDPRPKGILLRGTLFFVSGNRHLSCHKSMSTKKKALCITQTKAFLRAWRSHFAQENPSGYAPFPRSDWLLWGAKGIRIEQRIWMLQGLVNLATTGSLLPSIPLLSSDSFVLLISFSVAVEITRFLD